MKKFLKITFCVIFFAGLAFAAFVLGCNYYVYSSSKEYILDTNQFENYNADYILVLGASVRPGGVMSDMLHDRMYKGVELFEKSAAPVLLLSGDSENTNDYDETAAMKKYALESGVPEDQIVIDPVGLSTYESMVRAAELMEGKTVIIVTQKYHLYRSVYIARELGLNAYGCDSALRDYSGMFMQNIRELGARTKDVWYVKTKQPVKYGTERPLEKYSVIAK